MLRTGSAAQRRTAALKTRKRMLEQEADITSNKRTNTRVENRICIIFGSWIRILI
jgi:hypothetical protein